MADVFTIWVDGEPVEARGGETVAAVLLNRGLVSAYLAGKEGDASPIGRISKSGSPRAPLCGMGTCFECRVTVEGVPQTRGCVTLCQPHMVIQTSG